MCVFYSISLTWQCHLSAWPRYQRFLHLPQHGSSVTSQSHVSQIHMNAWSISTHIPVPKSDFTSLHLVEQGCLSHCLLLYNDCINRWSHAFSSCELLKMCLYLLEGVRLLALRNHSDCFTGKEKAIILYYYLFWCSNFPRFVKLAYTNLLICSSSSFLEHIFIFWHKMFQDHFLEECWLFLVENGI